MDPLAIANRRRLRRKLAFWRVVALVAVALVVVAIDYSLRPADPGFDRPHVASVSLSGVVTDDEDLVARLDRIADDPHVAALVLEVNSPGGTTYGGQAIYQAVRRVAVKKPVVSDIRSLGASAAYMVAVAGDHVVAERTSIVGSIGVLFQYPQVSGLLDTLGVDVEEIKSAPLKAEPSPFHPASDDAKAMIRSMIDDTYAWFVDLVAERRGMSHDKAKALADGSVFTGGQAVKNGLVDELGGERAARAWLTTKGVDASLPTLEWKARDRGGWGLFGRAGLGLAKTFASQLSGPASELAASLFDRPPFLDGMVSLWQFDGRASLTR
ncbi:signal peptide peptidase SppA [Pararhizobium mangrovi]|uniref:signal peptide peptidase SppA n=1 Tax=Pararhizobium mangrovi TaxID=2590452 RepID=UPI001F1AFC79|nr:signal peptide peptidase SppA [Pararhizobium mangrovi]